MSAHVPITAEELAEIEMLHREHVTEGQPIPPSRGPHTTALRAIYLAARLADRVIDLGRELEALRDAVRAHEASVRAGPRSRCWDQSDLALWAAAKVTS